MTSSPDEIISSIRELLDELAQVDATSPVIPGGISRIRAILAEVEWEMALPTVPRADSGSSGHPADVGANLPRIDHVGIVVRDLREAADLYVGGLGGRIVGGGDSPDELGMRTIHVAFNGGGKLELIEPRPGSKAAEFLSSRGEGVHHVTLYVGDIRGQAAHLSELGYRIVNPSFESETWKEFYLSPKQSQGCLVQVSQVGVGVGEPVEGVTLDAVIAGEWKWIDQRCVRL